MQFRGSPVRRLPLARAGALGVLSFFLLLCLNQPAESGLVVANLDDIAKAIESFFPKVSGSITGIQGAEVTFDLGSKSGISPGLILTVFRPGEVFTHPLTGEALGRFEDQLGQVEVKKVDPESSIGELLAPGPQIHPGDSIRLTAGRILITLVPGPSTTSSAVADDFQTALMETGRFLFAPKGTPASELNADQVRTASLRGIDYLLKVDAQSQDRSLRFSLTLLSTPRGTEIGHLDAQMEPSTRSDLTLENVENYLLLQTK